MFELNKDRHERFAVIASDFERRSSLRIRHLRFNTLFLISLAFLVGSLAAQESTKKPVDATGRENSPFSRNEADLPKGPAPRLGEHPDLSGYWIPSRRDKPVGNLGKDIRGYKLPFTVAGEAARKYMLNIRSTWKLSASSVDCRGITRADFHFSCCRVRTTPYFCTGTRLTGLFRSMGENILMTPILPFLEKRSGHGTATPLSSIQSPSRRNVLGRMRMPILTATNSRSLNVGPAPTLDISM